MGRKRLLITCFEPFGGRLVNASRDAVFALPDVTGTFEVQRLCLPVVFGRAAELALAEAGRLRPDVVMCVGEASGHSAITPEMVAINLRFARIPDSEGNAPLDEPVLEGGESALFSTLPVRAMAEAVREAGLPGDVSYSAGAYVCNDLMYLMLHHLAGTGVPCGFVHVPAQGLDAGRAARGLMAAIGALERL